MLGKHRIVCGDATKPEHVERLLDGASAQWRGDRKQSTVWNIDKPRKSETGHSVQKPVECMQRAIHNHKGDVYDPFAGSGTTLIAGEQEGRTVFALEIEPAYVDVTVKRWEDFTGRKATRERKRHGQKRSRESATTAHAEA